MTWIYFNVTKVCPKSTVRSGLRLCLTCSLKRKHMPGHHSEVRRKLRSAQLEGGSTVTRKGHLGGAILARAWTQGRITGILNHKNVQSICSWDGSWFFVLFCGVGEEARASHMLCKHFPQHCTIALMSLYCRRWTEDRHWCHLECPDFQRKWWGPRKRHCLMHFPDVNGLPNPSGPSFFHRKCSHVIRMHTCTHPAMFIYSRLWGVNFTLFIST